MSADAGTPPALFSIGLGPARLHCSFGNHRMKITGKDFTQFLKVNDQLSAYRLYFCSEYVSATILWKDSERHSTHIGYLTCLNHPAEDGTNPHWKIIIEIDETHNDKLAHISLEQFVEALTGQTPVKAPIWIELRESKSKDHKAIGDLWNHE